MFTCVDGMYMCICIYLYINTHTHSHCHELVWTCVHGSACVYIYIYEYLCTPCIYTHTHTHTITNWSGRICKVLLVCVDRYVCTFVHVCTCVCTHTHAHNIMKFPESFAFCLFWGSRFAYMCICMHVSVCVYRVFVCVCVYKARRKEEKTPRNLWKDTLPLKTLHTL